MTSAARASGWLQDRPYAHRGLHDAAAGLPENSRAAFAAAVRRGYGIELDVQLTADGAAAVFHDHALKRLTGEDGDTGARTLAELSGLHLLGTAETVPSLAEVLDLVGGRVPILVELKTERAPPELLEASVARTIADYRGPLAVMSFQRASVVWFARHAPDRVRGFVTALWPPEMPADDLDFYACDVRVLPARARDIPLLTWTVRTDAQLRRAAAAHATPIFEALDPDPRR